MLFRVKNTLNLVTSSVLGQRASSHASMTLAGCLRLYSGSPSESLRLPIAVIDQSLGLIYPPGSRQGSSFMARPSQEPTDKVTRPVPHPSSAKGCRRLAPPRLVRHNFGSSSLNRLAWRGIIADRGKGDLHGNLVSLQVFAVNHLDSQLDTVCEL